MEGQISLPEVFKIVDASGGPVTTNGGVTCDYVSLKNAVKAWIVAQFTQAVGHATTVQPRKATAVAGTGATNCTSTMRIWENEGTAASDTLPAVTAATLATLTNDIAKKLVVIEIDPAVEFKEDYDVLGCVISDSSQATNFVSVLYVLQTKYQQASPPAAITD